MHTETVTWFFFKYNCTELAMSNLVAQKVSAYNLLFKPANNKTCDRIYLN